MRVLKGGFTKGFVELRCGMPVQMAHWPLEMKFFVIRVAGGV